MVELLISFIQSDAFKSLLTIVLTAIMTYYVTGKTNSNNYNMNIKKLQLEKIYFPLYQYIYDKKDNDIQVERLYENMMIKRRKYFLYLSDTYFYYLKLLKKIDSNDSNSQQIIKRCKLYINYEYEKLKKELGYPYKNDFQNCYFVFYLVKILFSILNVILILIFSSIIIFNEFYIYYNNLINMLGYLVAIITIFDFITCVLYIFYKFLLYEYVHDRL